MKSIFKYIVGGIILSWAVVSVSCSDLKVGDAFLDKYTSEDMTIDSIFAKKIYAEQALAKAYALIPYGMPLNVASDRFVACPTDVLTDNAAVSALPAHGPGPMYNGSYSASVQETYDDFTICPFNNFNKGPWYGIRQAYLVAENMHKVQDMTEAEKARWAAEAKVLVALHYIDTFRHYGGLPWLAGSVSVDDDFTFARQTVEQTVNNIVALLDDAMKDLPWENEDATQGGHMTRASAMALKIRVLLFAASPLFNSDEPYMAGEAAEKHMTWYGNYDVARWERVIEACEQFEEYNGGLAGNAGVYKLVTAASANPTNLEYQKAYQDGYYTRSNGEVLVPSYDANYTTLNATITASYIFMVHTWGRWCPVANYAQRFAMADGTPFDWANNTHATDPFYTDKNGAEPTRDPRLYQTIVVNGSPYKSRTAQLYVGGTERQAAIHTNSSNPAYFGFRLHKFLLDETSAQGKIQLWPEMRLPEVLLSYAEALIQTGRRAEAYKYINTVRARVGLSEISDANLLASTVKIIVDEENPITTNGNHINFKNEQFADLDEAAMNLIFNERACEFGYENVRWFDVKRWKMEDVFATESRALDITKNGDDYTYSTEWVADGTITRTWHKHFNPKWYLMAFPTNEINKGYGLVQNPGWE